MEGIELTRKKFQEFVSAIGIEDGEIIAWIDLDGVSNASDPIHVASVRSGDNMALYVDGVQRLNYD